jgi:hypothetical protein
MNERVGPKMTKFCVVKLSNSLAIAGVPGKLHFSGYPTTSLVKSGLQLAHRMRRI